MGIRVKTGFPNLDNKDFLAQLIIWLYLYENNDYEWDVAFFLA